MTGEKRSDEQKLEMIRRDLYKTEWKQEAEEILPIAVGDEQELLIKCIDSVEPTMEELDELEEILGHYRPILRRVQPTKTLENAKDNITTVNDEKEFLEILRQNRERREETLTLYYPLKDGRELEIPLVVHPLTDSSAILDPESNLNLFRDFTPEEQDVYQRGVRGEELDAEESKLKAVLDARIEKLVGENTMDILIEYLACQTSIKDKEYDRGYMRELYTQMDVAVLVALMNKVQSWIGDVSSGVDLNRLFRSSKD